MAMRLLACRGRLYACLVAIAGSLASVSVQAQERGALERFQPSVAGDALFGVPSAAIGGHLQPRGTLIFDYAYKPLSIATGATTEAIVSHQLFMHANLSLALFDRLLVSADMPFALYQAGDSPSVAGVRFNSPSSAELSDLRLGARVRLYGGDWDAFQIGVGGYLYVPTAGGDSYAGEGSVRGLPHLLVGGRGEHFVYGLSLGTMLTTAAHPHSFNLGAGGAVVFADNVVQLGPELTLRVPFERDVLVDTATVTISPASLVSAELLIGAKFRPLNWLVVGAGAGPGLSQGWGTPVALAVGSIGYEPLSDPPAEDSDGDGIPNSRDACPDRAGVASDNAETHGCPEPAPKPAPQVPLDGDGDGIPDEQDACPQLAGERSDDPAQNGCPPKPKDSDGDGIRDDVDACPDEPGAANDDPAKNGCPRVIVTAAAIVIKGEVRFLFGRTKLDQTVDPVSNDLMIEVRDAITEHSDIELIEVQGHADSTGEEAWNVHLSEARANAVRDWLVARGIPAEKLIAKGYGSSQPRASNDSAAGRQQNRRVEFVIRLRRSTTNP